METKVKNRTDLYREITEKMISLIESGVSPWRLPWNEFGLAKNYQTGHMYSGINALLLNHADYESPYFPICLSQFNQSA